MRDRQGTYSSDGTQSVLNLDCLKLSMEGVKGAMGREECFHQSIVQSRYWRFVVRKLQLRYIVLDLASP